MVGVAYHSQTGYIAAELRTHMRLAQLARKLDVRPADIATFLEGKNIHIENGLNFRLDDQMVVLVLEQFGQIPHLSDHTKPDVESTRELTEVVDQPSVVHEADREVEVTEIEAHEEAIELIKAPKVELPGLRVLGKIDLPPPKPKVQEQNDSIAEDAGAVPASSASSRKKQRTDPPSRARKNPVTLQREREAREAERKKNAEAELEKEKRRQKYLSKVRINVPTKAARIFDEEVEELQQDAVAPASGPWRRFLSWLFRK